MPARKRRLSISRLGIYLLLLLAAFNFTHILKYLYPMPYSEPVIKYSSRAGIDPFLLVAIMKVESNFDPDAVSPKGARGLMQIMPETGQWIAGQINLQPYHSDLLFDPETNICLGAWYIANLENEFKENRIIILAAYNGGRGNVRRWLNEGVITWEVKDIDSIPFPETKNFIRKVLWNYKVYKWLYSDIINNNNKSNPARATSKSNLTKA